MALPTSRMLIILLERGTLTIIVADKISTRPGKKKWNGSELRWYADLNGVVKCVRRSINYDILQFPDDELQSPPPGVAEQSHVGN